MPMSLPIVPNEEQLRTKYAQDMVRLANYIKNGSRKSELLLVTNVSDSVLDSLYRAIVMRLFEEIDATQGE